MVIQFQVVCTPSWGQPREVSLRGRIKCVDGFGQQVSCSRQGVRYAIRSEQGATYYFLKEDTRSKIFEDARIRQRLIEVKAWLRAENQLEIVKVFSVKDGKLHDIHYFCEVCNVTAFSGGPCWCCQEEFELRETPVSEPR